MRNTSKAALGIVAAVLSQVIPAGAQPAPESAPPSTIATPEPARPTLPVIGTIFEHRADLGLSASQVETLERLSLGLVRELIRRQADLMIAQIDVDALLDQGPDKTIDVAVAEAKLREMEKIRTDLQLALVRAVEAARATLTVEQRSRLAPLLTGDSIGESDPADDPLGPVRAVGLAPSGGGAARGPGGGAPHPGGAGGGRPGVGAPHPGGPGGGGARPHPGAPGGGAPHGGAHGGRHDFHGHRGGGAFIGVWPSFWWEPYWYYAPPPVVVQEPPVYVQPPAYWYYCASARAYYPYVASCPETWILVPASP